MCSSASNDGRSIPKVIDLGLVKARHRLQRPHIGLTLSGRDRHAALHVPEQRKAASLSNALGLSISARRDPYEMLTVYAARSRPALARALPSGAARHSRSAARAFHEAAPARDGALSAWRTASYTCSERLIRAVRGELDASCLKALERRLSHPLLQRRVLSRRSPHYLLHEPGSSALAEPFTAPPAGAPASEAGASARCRRRAHQRARRCARTRAPAFTPPKRKQASRQAEPARAARLNATSPGASPAFARERQSGRATQLLKLPPGCRRKTARLESRYLMHRSLVSPHRPAGTSRALPAISFTPDAARRGLVLKVEPSSHARHLSRQSRTLEPSAKRSSTPAANRRLPAVALSDHRWRPPPCRRTHLLAAHPWRPHRARQARRRARPRDRT